MSTALPPLSTLISEIYQACSSPGPSLFLPAVILEHWPSADPWSLASFSFGYLALPDPTLPSRLCQAVGVQQLAQPASTVLTVSAITISSLGNAVLAQPTLQGCTVSFGSDQLPQSVDLARAPTVSASFSITRSCCTSLDGQSCTSPPQPCTITGSVTLSLTSSSLSLVLGIDRTSWKLRRSRPCRGPGTRTLMPQYIATETMIRLERGARRAACHSAASFSAETPDTGHQRAVRASTVCHRRAVAIPPNSQSIDKGHYDDEPSLWHQRMAFSQ